MDNAPDPIPDSSAEILARPVTTVMARPLQFADNALGNFIRDNPMHLTSISRLQAIMDIMLLIVGVVVWIALVMGTKFILESAPADDQSPIASHSHNKAESASSPADRDETGGAAESEEITKIELFPVIIAGMGCTAVALAIGRWRRLSLASVGLPRIRALHLLLGLAALVAAIAAHFLGIGITLLTWPNAWELMTKSGMDILKALPPGSIWKYFIMFMAVGFYEELLFRGFLLTRIRRVVGGWWLAIILSSALFAIMHLDLQQPTVLPSLFLLATAFSIFTVTTKSLYPAIIGHWLFNSIQIAYLHAIANMPGSPISSGG